MLRDPVRLSAWIGLFLFALLALCSACASRYHGVDGAGLTERAYAMVDRGDYGTAASCLQDALARSPDDLQLHDALAEVLDAMGRHEEALKHRVAYAKGSPDREAHWKLAQAYVTSARYEKAAEVLNECVRLGGGDELTYRFLAFCYDKSGAVAQADASRATADSLARDKAQGPGSSSVVRLKEFM